MILSSTPSALLTSAPPKSITLEATGDAILKEILPDSNLGLSSYLHIDKAPMPMPQDTGPSSSGDFYTLFRFDLSKHDSPQSIQSAVLRVKSANSCASGGYLQHIHNPHWDESTVTWNSVPVGNGIEIDRLGIVKSAFWYSFNVTSVLHHGHKTLSLRLYPTSSDACIFVSKDNPSGYGPELHILYDH